MSALSLFGALAGFPALLYSVRALRKARRALEAAIAVRRSAEEYYKTAEQVLAHAQAIYHEVMPG